MPFGDMYEWRVRHDVPSDVPDDQVADYIRAQVEAGTDPSQTDPEFWKRTIATAVRTTGLGEFSAEELVAFTDRFVADARETGQEIPAYLYPLMEQAIFGGILDGGSSS